MQPGQRQARSRATRARRIAPGITLVAPCCSTEPSKPNRIRDTAPSQANRWATWPVMAPTPSMWGAASGRGVPEDLLVDVHENRHVKLDEALLELGRGDPRYRPHLVRQLPGLEGCPHTHQAVQRPAGRLV